MSKMIDTEVMWELASHGRTIPHCGISSESESGKQIGRGQDYVKNFDEAACFLSFCHKGA